MTDKTEDFVLAKGTISLCKVLDINFEKNPYKEFAKYPALITVRTSFASVNIRTFDDAAGVYILRSRDGKRIDFIVVEIEMEPPTDTLLLKGVGHFHVL